MNAATNDAIWDYNLITGDTFYNDRVLTIFGYTQNEIKDNNSWWARNLHPADRERVVNKVNTILENNANVWHDEYRFRCKDNSYKTVIDRSYIIRDEQGKPLRLIGAMSDVTAIRQMEQHQLQEKLDKKNKVAKTIINAHEIEKRVIKEELHEDVNQLLASIKLTISQVAAERKNDSPELLQMVKHLEEAMTKIRNLSRALSSSSLEYFGLDAAIAELVHDMQQSNPIIDISYVTTLPEVDILEEELKNFIFRTVQDSIHCITEHAAGNTKIWINLCRQEKFISVQLQFNGTMDMPLTGNTPFKKMRGKLEMFDGQMQVSETPDNEYLVNIMIVSVEGMPLTDQPQAEAHVPLFS